MRYAHHILLLFNIVSCNRNALGSAFLQSSDSDIEVLLFFVFQPAICHAIRIRMANTVGDGVDKAGILDRSQCLSWRVIRCIVLAPSDFYLFHKLKEFMKGHKVSDDEDVICMTNGYLEDDVQQFFCNRIRALKTRWTKCISVAWEYVEKWQNMICVAKCVSLRTFWTPLVILHPEGWIRKHYNTKNFTNILRNDIVCYYTIS